MGFQEDIGHRLALSIEWSDYARPPINRTATRAWESLNCRRVGVAFVGEGVAIELHASFIAQDPLSKDVEIPKVYEKKSGVASH